MSASIFDVSSSKSMSRDGTPRSSGSSVLVFQASLFSTVALPSSLIQGAVLLWFFITLSSSLLLSEDGSILERQCLEIEEEKMPPVSAEYR